MDARTPRHHLPDEILVAYTTGDTSEAASLAAACHLTLCGHCQARVGDMEALAGALLERVPAAPVREDALDQLLARIDGEPDAPVAALSSAGARVPSLPAALSADLRLPRPLLRYLAEGDRWRFLVPGARHLELSLAPGATARAKVVLFKPGFVLPMHGHEGDEYTVIFQGGLEEPGARYDRGDVCFRRPGDQHEQVASRDEGCLALVVHEAPMRPMTVLGRILKTVAGV